MKIAILDCADLEAAGLDRHDSVGRLVETWLAPHMPNDTVFERYAIAQGAAFPEPIQYDGFILPGSECGVYDNPPWMQPLADMLLAIKSARIPLLGICFGHQMMAHTFGGRAAKAAFGMCVGPKCWMMDGAKFEAQVLHQDQVIQVPPGARVIGRADYCENGVIAYDFPALSMQFHPEYTKTFMSDAIVVLTGSALDQQQAKTAKDAITKPVPSDLFGDMAATFFITQKAP